VNPTRRALLGTLFVALLAVAGIGAAAAIPLLSGEGLPEAAFLDTFLDDPGSDAERAMRAEVRATMRDDGVLFVDHVATFSGDRATVTLPRPCPGGPIPAYGCARGFSANGNPVQVTERAARAEVTVSSGTTIAYSYHSGVHVWTDIAVLDWPVAPSSFGGTPGDLIDVSVSLGLPGNPAAARIEPHLHAASRERTTRVAGGTVTGQSVAGQFIDVQLHVAFPPGLVPRAPAIARSNTGGRMSFDITEQALEIASDAQAGALGAGETATGVVTSVREGINRAVAILALGIPALLWLVVLGMALARLRRLSEPLPPLDDVQEEPPSDHDPAVVAAIVASGKPGTEAVAGAILDLADRKAIEIQDLAGEAFTLRVTDAAVPVSPGESLLLETLRTFQYESGSDGRISAPPLWKRPVGLWRSFRRDAVQRAEREGLLEGVISTKLALAAIILTALGMAVLYAPVNPAAYFGAGIVLVVFAVIATLRIGYTPTLPGRVLQARWAAYANHLRRQPSVTGSPPAGVVVHGKALVYGAALGVAPEAVRLLAPPE
jgi:hypothetical protein